MPSILDSLPALRCPYYDVGPGSCTLWAYREAVCSTFFCKYVAGADGRKLWMSIKTLLSLVEIQLSRYALFKLHPEYIHHHRSRGETESGPLTADQLDEEAPPEAEYRAMWRGWTGREAELYRACFADVRGLSAADVERLLGLDGTLEQVILDRLYAAAVSPELPEVLRFNPDATVQRSREPQHDLAHVPPRAHPFHRLADLGPRHDEIDRRPPVP
ncbi:hypothetical protein [Sorangium sp. So ce131]|uniref:hypothetical protein n=1 Tax=Sorangium sp. So ce131 TaxID=3133282 RepID=UPI003F5DFA8F